MHEGLADARLLELAKNRAEHVLVRLCPIGPIFLQQCLRWVRELKHNSETLN